jgi:hypothetical protein
MDVTIFLAQLWGPVLLALGIGILSSRAYYVRVYRDLQKEPLAFLVFAMTAISAGIAQILAHNVWDTTLQAVISLLGWGTLAKGVLFAVAPSFVDRMGNWQAESKWLSVVATLLLVLGAYLTWMAYFV